MLSGDEREELKRMRDVLAERMHRLDEQVNYGQLSLDDKHHALSAEFGQDYKETLTSINQMLHEKQQSHHVVPHKHLTFIIALVAVAFAASLMLSAFSPSLTGQVVNTQLIITEQVPVRLAWDVPTQIKEVSAHYEGTGSAELIVQDATGAHTLLAIQNGAVDCVGCGITVKAPVLFEMQGEGTITITSLTTLQKP